MCRTLKVDAAPILSKLPQSLAPKLDKNDRGISMPAQGSGFLTANALMAFVSRPAVLLVAGLLLAALAVALFPQARSTVGMAESALGSVAVPMAAAPPVAADAAAAAPASNTRAAEPAPSPEIQPVAPVAAPVQATVPAAALASGSPAASPTASAPASGLLVFKASASAWIRVSDSHGVVQFEKTLAAGETAAASGVPPLAVVVGNVAATEVLLRGQPFKMQDLNQNNVARFEVK
jgi:cytoskeleton protein RodZ